MSAEFDVCVVGSSNLDLVATAAVLPAPGETVMGRDYHEHPGGKGLNQAVAAARAGASTCFVSALGDDTAADVLRSVMDADGIDRSRVRTVEGVATGRALIGVADSGENSIIVVSGANRSVVADDIPSAAVVLSQLEVPLPTIIAAFRTARGMGAVTVLNPAPAQVLDAELLGLCDIVVPNEHEVELLGGVDAVLAAGAGTVVVTLGAEGAMVHDRNGRTAVAPFAVRPVDTTGAGDTFCGALCARLAAGDSRADALRYASAAAALSTTTAGAVPSIPRRADVEALIAAG